MRRYFLLALSLLAIATWPAHAADVHRCIGADGSAIFTDSKCEDIGATVRPEPVGAITGTTARLGPRGCPRSLGALEQGLRSAVASGDVNRFAAFYNWSGINSSGSVRILDRLQAIVGRPLLSLDLIGTHAPQDADGFRTVASEAPMARPSAIELVQARSSDDPTPLRTQFELIRNADCWWVQF